MNIKLLFFLSVWTFLISCKKDKVEPSEPPINTVEIINTDHLTGNFLLEITDLLLYDQSQSVIQDLVSQMTVSGDTLKFNNTGYPVFFIIESDTQTIFTYSHANIFESASSTLVYSNNFNNIDYDYHSTSLSFGPDKDKSYSGARTNLEVSSSNPHPYLNEIEGDYIMSVVKKDFSTGLDTNYIDTLTVTNNGSMIFELDNMSFDLYSGHSHHKYRYEDSYQNETVNLKKWYRTPDSLYIEQLDYEGVWSTPHDTVQWVYYGKKL